MTKVMMITKIQIETKINPNCIRKHLYLGVFLWILHNNE